ncbi:halocyanin domain-containing protein [Halorussus caseinilyticus]|uniref:Halocyanin domain-containing protein n=1 Tax=Halorussus caseinilyticus TaxID=3034025 RepID=A0ABD5WF53_9EURY|nr:halocyanin domain-containing protein [Halorussus sp. DT72]
MKGAATMTAAASGLSGPATAKTDLAAWFENTTNYDGVVDETGKSEVTIEVGTKGNTGNFAFGPAAVRVDPGTKVVWEWTGKGSTHNVVAENGDFESELVSEEGHTFEYTPEESGVVKYACTPHKAMGMKGALVVGDAEVGSASGGESGHGEGEIKLSTDEYAIGGSILLGLLSPFVFAWILFKRDPDERGR